MTTPGLVRLDPGPLVHLDPLERALTAKGFPSMSPWWRGRFGAFYGAGRRQLVLRVGRRGGKSSSLCRVAVLEALYGEHNIPPGDLGVVAIVSVSRDEANQRLRTVKAILDAIGVKYRPIEGGIELEGRRVGFKVFAASVAGVSGFTCICAICDEVAKWRDADTGANPAKEVLASLRPTMVTQKHARIFLSSSPVGVQDAHAVAFDLGETAFQDAATAPTWVANPSVSEADTHDLEPDPRIWAREYAAVPQASVLGAFDPDDVSRAFVVRDVTGVVQGARVMLLDVSSGKKDAWTWAVASWMTPASGQPFLHVEHIGGLYGAFWKTTNGADVVAQLAATAKQCGATSVHGDQREEFMVRGEFAKAGVGFIAHPWTATSKPAAVEMVRRWMREGTLWLEEHERLRSELLAFEERITPAGAFTFGARGSGHDDHVALLITAAMVTTAEPPYLYAPPAPKVLRIESAAETDDRMREERRRRGRAASATREAAAAGWGRSDSREAYAAIAKLRDARR